MMILFEVWWLQFRYGLESGAHACGLQGFVAGARMRGPYADKKNESGLNGRTSADARLRALQFWVWKHAEKRNKRIDEIRAKRVVG